MRRRLDYDRDVLPLTPSGNATERHMVVAYLEAAQHRITGRLVALDQNRHLQLGGGGLQRRQQRCLVQNGHPTGVEQDTTVDQDGMHIGAAGIVHQRALGTVYGHRPGIVEIHHGEVGPGARRDTTEILAAQQPRPSYGCHAQQVQRQHSIGVAGAHLGQQSRDLERLEHILRVLRA